MQRARTSHAAGFTLVELLVVIGIIAVVIGILLPALIRARLAAQQAVCLSNMRQIAMADYLYVTENKGWLVPFGLYSFAGDGDVFKASNGVMVSGRNPSSFSGTFNVSRTWDYVCIVMDNIAYYNFKGGFVGRYLQNIKSLSCPSLELDLPNPPGTFDFPRCMYGQANFGGYELRKYGYLWNPPAPSRSPLKLGQIRSPSETVAFADAANYSQTFGITWPSQVQRPSDWGAQFSSNFHGVHVNRMGNVAFVDGHAEAIPAQLRNIHTYPGIAPAVYSVLQTFHLGELVPPSTKITDISSVTYGPGNAPTGNCGTKYDYYFWSNKAIKGL